MNIFNTQMTIGAIVIILAIVSFMALGGDATKDRGINSEINTASTATLPARADGFTGEVLAGSSAPLFDFKKSDYEAARTSGKPILLYFYANWCPICKEEVRDALYPAFNELTTSDIIGFRVNYNDSDTDADEKTLAREFGVAYQHTKVFIKNGERVLKSPESWDKKRYMKEIGILAQTK